MLSFFVSTYLLAQVANPKPNNPTIPGNNIPGAVVIPPPLPQPLPPTKPTGSGIPTVITDPSKSQGSPNPEDYFNRPGNLLTIVNEDSQPPIAFRLSPNASLVDTAILIKLLPEPLPLFGLGSKNTTTHFLIYPPSDPNAPNPKPGIPKALIRPDSPDAPPIVALNPSGGPVDSTMPNCVSQADQIRKQQPKNRNKGLYQQLRQCYEKQLLLVEQSNQKILQTYALSNLATTAYVMGDYLEAINYHQRQLKIAQAENQPIMAGMALAGIGAAHGALGDYAKAVSFYQQALVKLPEAQAPEWRSLVLRNIGNAHLSQKQPDQAIDYQQQSLTISRRINDQYGEAQGFGNLGTAYADKSEFAKSIDTYQKSLTIAQSIDAPLPVAQALLGLGTTYSYQKNFAKAIEYQQQSLTAMRELQAKLGEGISLTNLGDSLFRLQRFGEAETRLKEGVQVWESLRAGLGNNDAYKISIFETQLDTYRNLQEALIAQNKVAPALEIAEKSRARAFIELVARHRNPTATPMITAPTIEQIRQIARTQNATIVQYSIMRDQFVTASHGGSIQFTTDPKETAIFIWVVQPNGNVTFRRVDLNPNQTSIGELVNASRSTIGARGISVSSARNVFKAGDIVRRKGEPKSWQPYKVVAINSADRTATLSHPEIKLAKPVSFDELYTATTQQAQFYQFQALHEKLITPIADLLPKNPSEKVVFVPQERLFLVPFAALQNQKGEFLVEKHTSLTIPAIQLLGLIRRPTSQNGKALIIGNPTLMPQNYAPLPGATKEAQAIGQLLNVSPLIAQAATEASVKSQISQAKMIHFATHGFFDEAVPLKGGLALAPTGQEDGLLTAEEMLKLPLNADLVVLSACDTGRGKITGDGVLGLSRSWLAAGTSNLLVSLWAVDDQATSALMVDFYQSLKQQPDNAIALRQAMLKTMQKYPAPQDWAAFTLVGSPLGR